MQLGLALQPLGGGGALLVAFTISATDFRPEEEPSSCSGIFALDASLGGAGGQILVAVTAGEFGSVLRRCRSVELLRDCPSRNVHHRRILHHSR